MIRGSCHHYMILPLLASTCTTIFSAYSQDLPKDGSSRDKQGQKWPLSDVHLHYDMSSWARLQVALASSRHEDFFGLTSSRSVKSDRNIVNPISRYMTNNMRSCHVNMNMPLLSEGLRTADKHSDGFRGLKMLPIPVKCAVDAQYSLYCQK